MDKIKKHSFEAVSLLTKGNGMLEATIIPAVNQPDWIVPSALILDTTDCDERVWYYSWQQQEVAVFHLLPAEQIPSKMIILEGNTLTHRLALQTVGQLRNIQIRISDVKDIALPKEYSDNLKDQIATTDIVSDESKDEARQLNVDNQISELNENDIRSYLYQTIVIDDVPYLIPDLDNIAHQLVDLDRVEQGENIE